MQSTDQVKGLPATMDKDLINSTPKARAVGPNDRREPETPAKQAVLACL